MEKLLKLTIVGLRRLGDFQEYITYQHLDSLTFEVLPTPLNILQNSYNIERTKRN